jgi:hypothetical protein
MILPKLLVHSKGVLCTLIFALFLLFVSANTSFAQTSDVISSGVATMIEIKDQNISEGDIITFTPEGYKKSSFAYDPHVFGVVTENPQVVLEDTSAKNSHAVISTGKVYVKVSTANGPIKAGDLVTTSKLPGVAMRADESGYVIGTAVEGYAQPNKDKVGTILVVLSVSFNSRATTVSSNLIQVLRLALSSPEVSPVSALRYVLAAAIVLISFVFAIGYFGKVSATGVEAIGRNPLASRVIMMSMLFHISLALAIVLVGVAIAYMILIL